MRQDTQLIVALDVRTFEEAEKLIDKLSEKVDFFKVGLASYTAFGEKLLKKLGALDKKIFLDLKFHDIPNTVYQAVEAACRKEIEFIDIHALGGTEMIRQARSAIDGSNNITRPKLLAVTILTSMNEGALQELGIAGKIEENVLRLARQAKAAGADGVVASPREVGSIKKELGEDFLTVTPGVRPSWAQKGDQKRVMTPREAQKSGSDYIVVGRPIISNEDPVKAAEEILKELNG